MARQLADAPAVKGQRLAMTYQEWLDWEPGQHIVSKWVDGEVIVFTPPSLLHQDIIGFLFVLLSWYARAENLGRVIVAPFEMRLSSRRSRESDVVFVAREHLHRLDGKRLDGPADLAVEIVSPDSVARDRQEKLAEYAAAGVREYWLFDARPGRSVSAFYRLTDEGRFEPIAGDGAGRFHSSVLPGFWLDPAWLWQEPMPDPDRLKAVIAPDVWRRGLAAIEQG